MLQWRNLRIGMLPIGGAIVPVIAEYEQLPASKKLWVALAGPCASVLYGLVIWCAWLLNQQYRWAPAMHTIAELNFALAAINLMPIPPLDGFNALVSWLEMRGRPITLRTLTVAHRAGSGLVYGVGFLILGLALLR
jgi:Zn-dependent protease